MPRFSNISLRARKEHLGPEAQRRGSAGSVGLLWDCGGIPGPSCFARASPDDEHASQDVNRLERFDYAGLPLDGWMLNACPKHRELFTDYPEASD